MKRVSLFLILILSVAISTKGQDFKLARKVVHVVLEQSVYLNGQTKAAYEGNSKTYYIVKLPENTVEWYIAFTTSKNKGDNQPIGLYSQLETRVDPTGTIKVVLEELTVPVGSNDANVYLCDAVNNEKFMDKEDKFLGAFKYVVSGTRENCKKALLQVTDVTSGILYLGFKNPNASEGVNITFEVVAVVERKVPAQQTNNQKKGEMYAEMGRNAYEKGENDKSVEFNKKALQYDPNLFWVKFNMGLVYLLQGKPECIDTYVDAIADNAKSNYPREYLLAALDDVNKLKEGTSVKNIDEVVEILQGELKKY